MKKFILIRFFISLLMVTMVTTAIAQDDEISTDKRAQTGMKFLSVSLDARAAGMGDAVTASDQASPMGMFYNPATMANQQGNFSAALGKTQWIVDIDYDYAALSFRPGQGNYGVFGVQILSVNYGDIIETVRSSNESGYEDIGTYSPNAMLFGLGYAKALTSQFSVGGNVKYVREDLGSSAVSFESGSYLREENATSTLAYDFGVLYRTGFRSLTFAMTARNFSDDETYQEESFELPLTFRIGVSMDLVDLTSMDSELHSFVFSVDTERPRDFDEQIKVGGEYTFRNVLALRAGYISPTDEQGVSLGAGLRTDLGNVGFQLDYSYSDFGIFDSVNRFSAQFSF